MHSRHLVLQDEGLTAVAKVVAAEAVAAPGVALAQPVDEKIDSTGWRPVAARQTDLAALNPGGGQPQPGEAVDSGDTVIAPLGMRCRQSLQSRRFA
mmetsp:Transcript_8930/g.21390  ORF Transcript_8930/g.21390 Transcript_8930/m.21390 type:complete len:96 (+) Transcript_8930:320-607(+)